ncbi:MAG TPA: cbb3-type cytochrome c oxidase subunit I, partial [Ilumatobacter sp.]|nr:cbb3-type cytochrome c oxidase subunit I [Ilumatobacter sp.]
MTTIDTRPAAAGAAGDASAEPDAHESLRGVSAFFANAASWVTTTDHKKIGRLYTGFGLLALLAASVLGALLGVEKADSSALLDGGALLQLMQGYRVALVFGALVPLTLGLSVAVAPLQLGARSIAFPRVALTGFYAWLGGLGLTFAALLSNGGIGGADAQAVDMFLAGQGLMMLGLLATAGCVATSVLTTRAPGMTMRRVPLFAWASLVGSLSLLIFLPVGFGTIIYLFIDHRIGIQATFGGAEGIAAWIGFVYTTPAVIACAIPAVGVAAELVPVTFKSRQVMRGVKFAGIGLIGVSALSAVTRQVINPVSFDSDQSFRTFIDDLLPALIFAGLPLLGLVVSLGLAGLTAQQGLKHGKPSVSPAFVFAFFGLLMIALGILGNLVQSISDLELAGTSFEEGATLYLVYGSAIAVMGGLVFWAPKLWGVTLAAKAVLPLALLGVLGTVLAAFPLYIAAFLDAPGGIPSNEVAVGALLDTSYSDSAEL